jgi:hypothetical protein
MKIMVTLRRGKTIGINLKLVMEKALLGVYGDSVLECHPYKV